MPRNKPLEDSSASLRCSSQVSLLKTLQIAPQENRFGDIVTSIALHPVNPNIFDCDEPLVFLPAQAADHVGEVDFVLAHRRLQPPRETLHRFCIRSLID
jgi:hypothetical protein